MASDLSTHELRSALARLRLDAVVTRAEVQRLDELELAAERQRLLRCVADAKRELAQQRTRLFYRRALHELMGDAESCSASLHAPGAEASEIGCPAAGPRVFCIGGMDEVDDGALGSLGLMATMLERAAALARAFIQERNADHFRMLPEILCTAARMATDLRMEFETAAHFQGDSVEAPLVMAVAGREASDLDVCLDEFPDVRTAYDTLEDGHFGGPDVAAGPVRAIAGADGALCCCGPVLSDSHLESALAGHLEVDRFRGGFNDGVLSGGFAGALDSVLVCDAVECLANLSRTFAQYTKDSAEADIDKIDASTLPRLPEHPEHAQEGRVARKSAKKFQKSRKRAAMKVPRGADAAAVTASVSEYGESNDDGVAIDPTADAAVVLCDQSQPCEEPSSLRLMQDPVVALLLAGGWHSSDGALWKVSKLGLATRDSDG